MYINVGSPGRCNDSTIYENSILKQQLQNTTLLKEFSLPMGLVNVYIVVLADSAFYFKFGDLFKKKKIFSDNQISNVNKIIKACCVLHNFLIKEKDEIDFS